jgi:PAS domain S-box-containing protein
MNLHEDAQKIFASLGSMSQILPIFDLLPDVSFFIKDRQGRFLALNRLGCEFCGVRAAREAYGKTDRDFFPRDRADAYIADDRVVMRTGRPVINRIEAAPEKEGSPHLVVTSKMPLRDPSGKVVGVIGFSRRVEQVRCAPAMAGKLADSVAYLHEHSGEPVSTEALARRAGLSVSQFERTFRKAFGASPRQYILRVRIEKACRLLTESDATVAFIAVECGFYDHAHFTRGFRALMSESPTEYRKKRQGL